MVWEMRKLASFAFAFAVAVYTFIYVVPTKWAITLIVAIFLLGALVSFLLRGDERMRAAIIAAGLLVGTAWSFSYDALVYNNAYEYDGERISVTAKVTDYAEIGDRSTKLPVKIERENGRPIKTMLYIYDDDISEFRPGDKVEFTGKFSISYERDSDDSFNGISKGYLLYASTSHVEIIESPGLTLEYAPRFIAHALNNKILEVFPDRTEGFAQAIVTGERDLLYDDEKLTSDMTASGILHIVSVSGMHVVFLAGFIVLMFGNRPRTALITIPIILLFMAVIGFTPSVTRAGIMQIFLLTAPLLKRQCDSITALAFALMLLLFINPYSATSIGLQLSFSASLGIILFAGKIYTAFYERFKKSKTHKKKFMKAAARFVIGSFATTLGALALSTPVSVCYFGFISLVSPITNLLILWAASIAFSLAIVAALIGFVFMPLGILVAYAASIFFEYIMAVCGFLSSFPLAAIYTDNEFIIYWLVYVYVMLLAFLLIRGNLRRLILPGAFSTIVLCVILLCSALSADNKNMSMTVLDVGQGQSLLLTSGSATAVIDCGSSNGDYAGDTTADYIKSLGRQRIDLLILTHFHEDHANGVDDLFAQIDVSAIAVPLPLDSNDGLSAEVINSAEKYGAEIIYVTENISVDFAEAEIEIYAPVGSLGENERGLTVVCTSDDFDILVTGDMGSPIERILLETYRLPDIEAMIVGHHGSKYSTSVELLDKVKPETAVISVGDNIYGHPTNEVLTRLSERNIEVYRTDLHGHVTINAG